VRFPVSSPLGALAALVVASGAVAQSPDSLPAFERAKVMVAMRDGVRLHTLIFAPKAAPEPLPFLLTRTPYGIDASLKRMQGSYAELARDGYVFVFQDSGAGSGRKARS
jgi:predicted acyl esterase